jgi:hypothetical protein
MTATTTTTQENETRVNVEIDISRDAAFSLISLITSNLLECVDIMDDDEFYDLARLSRALQKEVY